jgi:ribosomal 50S subunit-recycling heat shock protein
MKVAKDMNSITVEPTAPDNGKITVNGNLIKTKTLLHHKDTIIFGLKNAFKVIIPKQRKPDDEKELEGSDYDSILSDRLNNNTPEAACMRKYLEET